MTMADILIGLMIVTGFFVSAAISRLFRRGMTGIIIGGVAGLGVSVAILYYSLDQLFDLAPVETTDVSN